MAYVQNNLFHARNYLFRENNTLKKKIKKKKKKKKKSTVYLNKINVQSVLKITLY